LRRKRISITGYGLFMGITGERFIIKKGKEVLREIPAFEVSQVILDTGGATLSSAAMRLMLKHGIELLIMRGGRLLGKLSPVRRGSNIHLKLAQYEAQNSPIGVKLARAFAMGKLRNQSDMLRSLAKNRSGEERKSLNNAARDIKSIMWSMNEIDGSPEVVKGKIIRMEAEAGRIYWSAIASILPSWVSFDRRRQRFDEPEDPFNISLNYLYSILLSEAWFILETTGFEPFIGFLHVPSNRRAALAADFMEEFRQPVVDRAVLSLVKEMRDFVENKKLRPEARKKLLDAYEKRMNVKVTFKSRYLPIRGHMVLQARRLASVVMGKSKAYDPFGVRW